MPSVSLMIEAPFSMSSSSKRRVPSSRALSFFEIIKNKQIIMARGELMAMHTFCSSGYFVSTLLIKKPSDWQVPQGRQKGFSVTPKPDISTITPYLRIPVTQMNDDKQMGGGHRASKKGVRGKYMVRGRNASMGTTRTAASRRMRCNERVLREEVTMARAKSLASDRSCS